MGWGAVCSGTWGTGGSRKMSSATGPSVAASWGGMDGPAGVRQAVGHPRPPRGHWTVEVDANNSRPPPANGELHGRAVQTRRGEPAFVFPVLRLRVEEAQLKACTQWRCAECWSPLNCCVEPGFVRHSDRDQSDRDPPQGRFPGAHGRGERDWWRRAGWSLVIAAVLFGWGWSGGLMLQGAELHVGPGQPWSEPAAAVAAARAGDVIVVHPRPGNVPYVGVALRVRQPGLILRGAAGLANPVPLSGEGAELSGRGPHPRAIVQFDAGADGAGLEGFELMRATNATGNAAGVRVTGARNVVVRDCVIHDNDMGVMSDGADEPDGGAGFLVERCIIYGNGSAAHAGYSHNLYLGGAEVTVLGSVIHSSRVGHNLKSRAHRTRVLACFLHGAAERELDLVDAAGWTTQPGSDAWVAGCVIVKADPTRGNGAVVHFGQDGGQDHTGTLWLVHNTIVTPHVSPVVELSAPAARAWLEGNLIWDKGRRRPGQRLIETRGAAKRGFVQGRYNWLAAGFRGGFWDSWAQTRWGEPDQQLPWNDPPRGDYRLREPVAGIVDAGDEWASVEKRIPGIALYEFVPPLGWRNRPRQGRLDLGAFEAVEGNGARSGEPGLRVDRPATR